MTPKNRIIEGKNRIKGGGEGVKNDQKNRTSFMHDPLGRRCIVLHLNNDTTFWNAINLG